jgi:hypothetical protein
MAGAMLLLLGTEESLMTTKAERRQRVWRQYRAENGADPVTMHELAAWAVKRGLEPAPEPVDPMSQLADEYSKALREEERHDSTTGRTYRANHAVTESRGGKQYTLWGDIDEQPRAFVLKSFTQRRQQIVGDCLRLTLDCDHFTAARPDEEPIQMPLDFTDDVAERKALLSRDDDAEAGPPHDA